MTGRRAAGLVALTIAVLAVFGPAAVEFATVLGAGRAAAAPGRDPGPPTPVLVLGGDPARITAALALPGAADGSRTLVASADAARDLVELGGDCSAPRTICVEPVPATTRGEARLGARLAADAGWEVIVVVTSWWHVRRAELHLAACLDVPVVMLGAGDPADLPTPLRLLEEVVGSLDARLRPECADGGS